MGGDARYTVHRKDIIAKLAPEQLGLMGVEAIESLLQEAKMPHTIQQLQPILDHADHSKCNHATQAAERMERAARAKEITFEPRVWNSVREAPTLFD